MVAKEHYCRKTDKIAELDARICFEQKKTDDIDRKISQMDEKIDTLNENITDLLLKSERDDKAIEGRLVAMETKFVEINKAADDNYTRLALFVSFITIAFTALNFILDYLIH